MKNHLRNDYIYKKVCIWFFFSHISCDGNGFGLQKSHQLFNEIMVLYCNHKSQEVIHSHILLQYVKGLKNDFNYMMGLDQSTIVH